jgi:tripartite-type tricarboxylate transporter receptor subunit TctC
VFTPVPFDPFRDFTHIAYLGGQPGALFADKDLPFGTLSDLVAYAKSRPGALTYATISIGSQTQLLNEEFQTQAGIKMTHVPYRAAPRRSSSASRFEASVIGEPGSCC